MKKDTASEDYLKDKVLIEEVVKSKTVPGKEKVEYFSQVTRYGFKNLFSNYKYNTALPYAAQVNPNAEQFVQDYMRRHSRYLNDMKDWGKPYFNLIENVLQQYGLPAELKYIAVIESNLKTSATSPVGAGGPWQFMPYTARQFGLVVNQYTDDRRDYYKSTHAAARYLLSLYKDLHDWLLVMAAYNGGPGRVYSAIKKSGSRNFWHLQYHLPEESRTYVKRFIATHYIMEGSGGITTIGNTHNHTDYALPSKHHELPDSLLANTETLALTGKYNSLVIAKNLEMDAALFNRLNPNFDLLIASEGNFTLRLPADKMQLFVAHKYDILNECVQVMLGQVAMPANKTVYPETKKKKG
ncbi:MAG TPA: lytic transglycosylase domain-containing protein [Ferruginibacter sp.]|nr:lytic transglycosylase domain-containing protein [Ferruginibacter sp.]